MSSTKNKVKKNYHVFFYDWCVGFGNRDVTINILGTCWEHDLFPCDLICIKLEFYSWITCWATQNYRYSNMFNDIKLNPT